MVRFQSRRETIEKHIIKHVDSSQMLFYPKIELNMREKIEDSRDCQALFTGNFHCEMCLKGN